jgi:serine O-acetyltransferase
MVVFMVVVKKIYHIVRQDLHAFLKNDPSVQNIWDIILFSISFKGLFLYRIYHELFIAHHTFLAKLLYYHAKRRYHMDIHPAADIEPGIIIDHDFGVVIGETATVGSGTIIYHGVTLGARGVQKGQRHPHVGRNVLIGNHASILGNIRIGDGARIGANSVVLADVPSNTTVVGIPAVIVKKGGSQIDTNRKHADDAA